MAMPAAERETIITGNDEERLYRVWTAERRMVTAFKKKADRFQSWEVKMIGGSEVFEGVISADDYSPATGVKRQMSNEAMEAAGERLRKARESA